MLKNVVLKYKKVLKYVLDIFIVNEYVGEF